MMYTILDRWGNAWTIQADGAFASLEEMLDALVAVIIGRAIAQAETVDARCYRAQEAAS